MYRCTFFCLHALVWAPGRIATASDVPRHCVQDACLLTKSPVLMQLTQKKHKTNPIPAMDADADFIEDANNPLEKMYALEDAREDPMTAKNVAFVQDAPEFDCKEGVSMWKLGWSSQKMDFCCRTAQVGCVESTATKNNDTRNNTNTETDRSGNETDNATDNSTGSTNETNNTSNVTNLSTCVTREDPRASSTFYTTSKVGTPCVFGVDPRDEGSHCIMEGGKYGSFGWCYTSESKQSWGSCSESCPLFGPSKVLGAKINKLDSELGDRVRAELEKVLADTKQGNSTAVPTQGQTTELTTKPTTEPIANTTSELTKSTAKPTTTTTAEPTTKPNTKPTAKPTTVPTVETTAEPTTTAAAAGEGSNKNSDEANNKDSGESSGKAVGKGEKGEGA